MLPYIPCLTQVEPPNPDIAFYSSTRFKLLVSNNRGLVGQKAYSSSFQPLRSSQRGSLLLATLLYLMAFFSLARGMVTVTAVTM